MKYTIDHDLHIHSFLSTCAKNPAQTPDLILERGKERGLSTLCLTNHFWDEEVEGASPWYRPQNFPHLSKEKDLPQGEGIRFLFGCETELNRDGVLGISPERTKAFDFIIIPTTHFHMEQNLFPEDRESHKTLASAWARRLETVLSMPLPFHKIGIAHLACSLIAKGDRELYRKTLDAIPEEELERLFSLAAKKGAGIELNVSDMSYAPEEETCVLRIFRAAKRMGCKFYLGSDAHSPKAFDGTVEIFQQAVSVLGLTENDKFIL